MYGLFFSQAGRIGLEISLSVPVCSDRRPTVPSSPIFAFYSPEQPCVSFLRTVCSDWRSDCRVLFSLFLEQAELVLRSLSLRLFAPVGDNVGSCQFDSCFVYFASFKLFVFSFLPFFCDSICLFVRF